MEEQIPTRKISKDEFLSYQTAKIPINVNQEYKASTNLSGKKGEAYCAYFTVIILDSYGTEINRHIRWITDFTSQPKNYEIIFPTQPGSKYAVIGYRINIETPIKSDVEIDIPDITSLKLEETVGLDHLFDDINDYVLPASSPLTAEEENVLEKNIVWIFGSPRSGTSWLGLQLLSHQTYSMNEPFIGRFIGSFAYGVTDRIIRDIEMFGKKRDFFFSNIYANTWKFHLRKLILNRIYAQFHDLKRKIIIKEPNGSWGSDIITDLMPKSKIIILLRDGRDIIDSQLDSIQKDAWGTKMGYTALRENQRLQYIEKHTKIWVRLTEILMSTYDKHAEHLRLFIRYEELRENTFSVLKRIYEFLTIPIVENELQQIIRKYSFENIPAELKGKGKVTRSATPGKWKESFTTEEKNIMERIMGDTLRKLGY